MPRRVASSVWSPQCGRSWWEQETPTPKYSAISAGVNWMGAPLGSARIAGRLRLHFAPAQPGFDIFTPVPHAGSGFDVGGASLALAKLYFCAKLRCLSREVIAPSSVTTFVPTLCISLLRAVAHGWREKDRKYLNPWQLCAAGSNPANPAKCLIPRPLIVRNQQVAGSIPAGGSIIFSDLRRPCPR